MKKLILFIISTTIFCINLSAQKATVDNSTISVYFVNLTNKKTNLINNFGFALEFRYFVTHTNAINLAIKTDYFTQSGSWAKGITLGYSLASSKKVKE